MIKTKADIRRVTDRIVNLLMTNGNMQKAARLQLRGPNEEDLGGMIRDVVDRTISDVLKQETKS